MRVFLYARRMFKCEATVSEGKEVKNKKKTKGEPPPPFTLTCVALWAD